MIPAFRCGWSPSTRRASPPSANGRGRARGSPSSSTSSPRRARRPSPSTRLRRAGSSSLDHFVRRSAGQSRQDEDRRRRGAAPFPMIGCFAQCHRRGAGGARPDALGRRREARAAAKGRRRHRRRRSGRIPRRLSRRRRAARRAGRGGARPRRDQLGARSRSTSCAAFRCSPSAPSGVTPVAGARGAARRAGRLDDRHPLLQRQRRGGLRTPDRRQCGEGRAHSRSPSAPAPTFARAMAPRRRSAALSAAAVLTGARAARGDRGAHLLIGIMAVGLGDIRATPLRADGARRRDPCANARIAAVGRAAVAARLGAGASSSSSPASPMRLVAALPCWSSPPLYSALAAVGVIVALFGGVVSRVRALRPAARSGLSEPRRSALAYGVGALTLWRFDQARAAARAQRLRQIRRARRRRPASSSIPSGWRSAARRASSP